MKKTLITKIPEELPKNIDRFISEQQFMTVLLHLKQEYILWIKVKATI